MTPPVAELTSVSREFELGGKPIPVLKDIHLSVRPGDRIVLFGPSGCGKTTLIHLLALLDAPSSGVYSLEGVQTGSLSETDKAQLRAQKIGLIFQRFHLLPYHSVIENVMLRTRYLDESPPSTEERVLELLDQVGLSELAHRPARLLSGGEQQRVCIARACFHRPALLLADEPTGNLDRTHSNTVQDLLREVSGTAPVVVATHDPTWLTFANRVFHFDHGLLTEESDT